MIWFTSDTHFMHDKMIEFDEIKHKIGRRKAIIVDGHQ